MATQTHFAIFKSFYDDENMRLSELVTRAKVYLSVETFFIGTLFFKFDAVLDVAKNTAVLPVAFALSALFLFAAMLLTISSLRILSYEAVCDPVAIVKKFGTEAPQETEFLDDRIVDLAVATERNRAQNEKRASCLRWSGMSLLIGFASSVAFLLIALMIRRT